MVDAMKKNNADVVEMNSKRFWGPIKRICKQRVSPQTISSPDLFEKYYISFFGVNLLSVRLWGKLYKVELLKKADLAPSGFKMGEDLMFNMKLFPHIKVYTIIEYPGYNYRVGGITSRDNANLWSDLKAQYF